MEESTINSCFRTAVLQGIVCGALIGLHRFRNPSGRLVPIPWHIVARQYNVSISTNAFSPIHVATSSSLLGFLGTSSLSYAICRNEIATQQAQLQVLRELEQKAAELQADNKATDNKAKE